jgi:hypothetical protein
MAGERELMAEEAKDRSLIVVEPEEKGRAWVAGRYDDAVTIVSDIIAPDGEPWEALIDGLDGIPMASDTTTAGKNSLLERSAKRKSSS